MDDPKSRIQKTNREKVVYVTCQFRMKLTKINM